MPASWANSPERPIIPHGSAPAGSPQPPSLSDDACAPRLALEQCLSRERTGGCLRRRAPCGHHAHGCATFELHALWTRMSRGRTDLSIASFDKLTSLFRDEVRRIFRASFATENLDLLSFDRNAAAIHVLRRSSGDIFPRDRCPTTRVIRASGP